MDKQVQVREFNVVGVKFNGGRLDLVEGLARVETTIAYGVPLSSRVIFQGRARKLIGVNTGLSGSCVVLGAYDPDADLSNRIWWLYTDTPTGEHPSIKTPEQIRKVAEERTGIVRGWIGG